MKNLLYLLLVLLLGFLFFSSSQTYEEQSLIENLEQWLPEKPLEGSLASIQIPYGNSIVSIEDRGYYRFIEFLIRKGAHFVLFGLVGLTWFLLLSKFKPILLRFTISFLLTFLCACFDEYHQSITGGRTPSFHDVLLDMAGACFFIIVYVTVRWLLSSRKKIRKHSFSYGKR
ncbi:VanZ family protein [Lysinibacillus sp. SGAir0095]|uniref:VanZ family protein n=1 Tax=Lysinibacillus sp. SGAir0095 TaxID=2070463 RepID=UPI0010CCBCE7|nr:VanZ family protein [Lysinibacillus sp. SGAir0095]QCR31878.1 VanZ family protein [Lysinibacillus sp. SGAir0095]